MSNLVWRSLADVRREPMLPLDAGDLVRTGENFHPHFRIIAVNDDRAWVREVQHGTDHVVPLGHCRRL